MKPQCGDAILWYGDSVLGNLFQRKFSVSHVSLMGMVNSVYEMMPRGIEVNFLPDRLNKFDVFGLGRPCSGVAKLYHLNIRPSQRELIHEFAFDCYQRRVKYDYPNLWRALFARAIQNPTRYLCWEFVVDAWVAAGLLPKQEHVPDVVETLASMDGVTTELRRVIRL